MSNIGLLASRFELTQRSLESFDNAIAFMRRGDLSNKSAISAALNALLGVLIPVTCAIKKELANPSDIDEMNVASILMKRTAQSDKASYKKALIGLTERLQQGDTQLTSADVHLLNDIGDALLSECAQYFQRIRSR